jgi:hypothetical protein
VKQMSKISDRRKRVTMSWTWTRASKVYSLKVPTTQRSRLARRLVYTGTGYQSILLFPYLN